MTETMPAASYVRVSQALAETGVRVTPSAVRYVWQRLLTRSMTAAGSL